MAGDNRLNSIEVMRGFAALGVAWFHISMSAPHWMALTGYEGRLGVPVFFVISGFVIPHQLHRANYQIGDIGRFLARRIVRIELPFVASIGLWVVLAYVFHQASFSIPQLLANAFYVAPLVGYPWITAVYWTLAYEFVFYLLAAVLFPVIWRRELCLIAVGLAATFAAPGAMGYSGLIGCFLIGILAARWRAERRRAAVLIAGAALCSALMIAQGGVACVVVGLPTAAAILWWSVPRLAPLTALGAISYSLYLVHEVATKVFWGLFPGPSGVLRTLAMLVFAIALSTAFWWLVERPALTWARLIRITGGRRAEPAPLAEAPT